MQTQTRLFPTEYPPRPKRRSEEVQKRAVNLLLPAVLSWLGPDAGDEEEVRNQLYQIIKHGEVDGYALAKKLDHESWSPDAQLVEILDGISYKLTRAHEDVVCEWVRAHDLQLSLKAGDLVTCVVNDNPHDGVIFALDHVLAEYTVRVPSGLMYRLPFEQVQPRSEGSLSAAL